MMLTKKGSLGCLGTLYMDENTTYKKMNKQEWIMNHLKQVLAFIEPYIKPKESAVT